jgi:folate-binding Fe-S cluster repair protein YgfZ
VTNDVHALCAPATSGSAASLYAGVLTPKGKIFADVFLQRFERGGDGRESENGFYIDVDVDKCDEVRVRLRGNIF